MWTECESFVSVSSVWFTLLISTIQQCTVTLDHVIFNKKKKKMFFRIPLKYNYFVLAQTIQELKVSFKGIYGLAGKIFLYSENYPSLRFAIHFMTNSFHYRIHVTFGFTTNSGTRISKMNAATFATKDEHTHTQLPGMRFSSKVMFKYRVTQIYSILWKITQTFVLCVCNFRGS